MVLLSVFQLFIYMKNIKLPLISYCGIEYNNRRWSSHLMRCETCKLEHLKANEAIGNAWNKLCGCGCGEVTKVGKDFIKGHAAKLQWTDEKKKWFSELNRTNNPMFILENRRFGEHNPSKRIDVRKKLSDHNAMKNPEHKKVALEKRKEAGYEKTKNLNKTLWQDKDLLERRIKTYCSRLANGEIKLKNNWKTGYFRKSDGTEEWFDSSYEELRMDQLDQEEVKWTKIHGIKIPYTNEKGLNTYYVPDFYIEVDGVITIEEVKGWIKKSDLLKAEAGINFCKENKYSYRFLLGKELKKIEDLSYEHNN